MWKLGLLILSLAATPVFGQITISATRSINLQPDEVSFSLSVSSGETTSLDQIVAALSSLGITSASLTGVGSSTTPPTVQWNFTLAVPLPKLAPTIGSLLNLQQSIAQNNSGLTLTFYAGGTQVSPMSQQLQQSQSCSNSDLISDATAQAQKLAAAAGLVLGPILRLSTVPLIRPSAVPGVVYNSIPGDFAELLLAPIPPSLTCSLVVQFQLQP
jgi:uncharacterized protein YggE